ncbi:MAG: alpha/beta hydrolase [Myxococcota bacterium]
MVTRVESRLGLLLLSSIRRWLRRRVGAKVHRFKDSKGRTTPWLELGPSEGPILVWLHGFSDRPDGFLRTAGQLADRFRIVAPAVPSFHEGWRDPDEIHTLSAYADWLEPVIRQAVKGHPYFLVGNSLGGALSLELASRRPTNLRGLVAVNAAGIEVEGDTSIVDEFHRGDSPFNIQKREQVGTLFRRILGRPVRIPFPFEAALYREYAQEAAWYMRLSADISNSEVKITENGWRSAIDLSSVEVPALVLWGERDTLFPQSHAKKMAEALPHGRLEWMEGIGHSPHLEQPRRLARSIRGFVDSLPAA